MIRMRALVLALVVSAAVALPARSQWFGYGGGLGYGGMYGYGGGFGFPGYGYGGGYGYPGFGLGYGFGVGYPWFGGYPPYAYPDPGFLTYGFPGAYPFGGFAGAYGFGAANPMFNLGLSPLATQTALSGPLGYGLPTTIRGYNIVIRPSTSSEGIGPEIVVPGTVVAPAAPKPKGAPEDRLDDAPEPD